MENYTQMEQQKLMSSIELTDETKIVLKKAAVCFSQTFTEIEVNQFKEVFNEMMHKMQLTSHECNEAIRNGSLSDYGYFYKLTPHVISLWIREYKKNKVSSKKGNPYGY